MAINSNILLIFLDGTGTEIPTLNVSDPYEKYLITGAVTAIGNYAIVPTGSPQQGTTFLFKYKATTDITTNGTTFAIFGQQLTQNQLLIELDIECYYTGSQWIVEVKPSLTTQFLETVNIVASAITTSTINNLAVTTAKINTNAVTNAKLAQMSTMTVKANVTGGTADPSDIPVSTLSTLITGNWSTTGNSGLTAGTNYLGTSDAIDLLFKANSIKAGLIDVTNYNTSFGLYSLNSLTGAGVTNTAVGHSSLKLLTSGNRNTAFGLNALYSSTTSSFNTAFGSEALISNILGEGNTALGDDAGNAIVTGDYNTCIGANATPSDSNANNTINLGTGASADLDNQFAIPDDITTIKFKGITYTLPTTNTDGVLTNTGGVLTWV